MKQLTQLSYAELKGLITGNGTQVTEDCPYSFDEVKNEINTRDKQVDNIYADAKNKFGSTLEKLSD